MSTRTPSYRLHRGSGQAVVTLSGKDYYLGTHNTTSSRAKYDRMIADWLANGRRAPDHVPTIGDLCQDYTDYAMSYYTKQGDPTSTCLQATRIADVLESAFGSEKPDDFGPKKLIQLRNVWIGNGLTRNTVNQYVSQVVDIFRWGVSQELASAATWQALQSLSPLTKGRTTAKDNPPIAPVEFERVRAVIACSHPKLAALIRIQLLTGMRSGEMLAMRPCDLDRSGNPWIYRPALSKMQHKGIERTILIGEEAWPDIELFLAGAEPTQMMMTIRPCIRRRHVMRPSVLQARVVNHNHNIMMACLRAWPCPDIPDLSYTYLTAEQKKIRREHLRKVRWTPHQLRHCAATVIRRELDLDSARVQLGHTNTKMTERYAAADDAARNAAAATTLARIASARLLPQEETKPAERQA